MNERLCEYEWCRQPLLPRSIEAPNKYRKRRFCGHSCAMAHRNAQAITSLRERILSLTMPIPEAGCWIWMGAVDRGGYGVIQVSRPNRKLRKVHKASFEEFTGVKVPGDLQIDHKCRVRSCCNPDHLQIITPRENTLLGNTPAAENLAKRSCINGHPFDEINTVYRADGARGCKTCRRANDKRRRAARKMICQTLIAISVLSVGGCAGSFNPQPPIQPTTESIQAINARVATITADPITTWQSNDWAIRSACYDYLNQQAQRSADLSLAGGALGMAGGAAALASAHPAVAAAAALGSAFLNLYQQSGVIPYTTETTTLIEAALDGVEAVVALSPPTTTALALLDVQKLWWQCSAGGYKQLVSQSVMMGARNIRSMTSVTGVPRISIEPSPPAQLDVVNTLPPDIEESPRAQPHRTHRGRPPQPAATTLDPADPDKPARLQWLRETSTYIRALDGPR